MVCSHIGRYVVVKKKKLRSSTMNMLFIINYGGECQNKQPKGLEVGWGSGVRKDRAGTDVLISKSYSFMIL